MEPVDWYVGVARRLNSLVKVIAAAESFREDPEEFQRWKVTDLDLDFFDEFRSPFADPFVPSLHKAWGTADFGWMLRFAVSHVVSYVLQIAGVRVWQTIAGQSTDVRITFGSVEGSFAMVAVQLMNVACGGRPLAVCTHCSQPYSPRRWPKKSQKNWCSSPSCHAAARRYWKQCERGKPLGNRRSRRRRSGHAKA